MRPISPRPTPLSTFSVDNANPRRRLTPISPDVQVADYSHVDNAATLKARQALDETIKELQKYLDEGYGQESHRAPGSVGGGALVVDDAQLGDARVGSTDVDESALALIMHCCPSACLNLYRCLTTLLLSARGRLPPHVASLASRAARLAAMGAEHVGSTEHVRLLLALHHA